jgi:hypothetical protein
MTLNRNLDLVAICAWAAMTVIAVGHSEYQPLRLVLALPLLLLFTGHAVLRAFGPSAKSRTEHVVYAIGLSLAAALMGGFLLNSLGALTPLGWALWLEAVVAASTAIALVRQPNDLLQLTGGSDLSLRARHLVMIVVSGTVICGAYFLAVRDEARQQEFKYVEFWLVGGEGGAGALVVGIKSAELRTQVFDVEVTRGSDVVAIWRSVRLEPGATWTQALSLDIDARHERKVRARLYGRYDGRLYRQVTAIVPSA